LASSEQSMVQTEKTKISSKIQQPVTIAAPIFSKAA